MSKAGIAERKEYLRKKVNPILENLVADLMKDRPAGIVRYMVNWLETTGNKIEEEQTGDKNKRPDGVESSEDDSDEDVDSLPIPIPKSKNQARVSVSAEAYGDWNKKAVFVPKSVSKSDAARSRIETRLGQAFMFSALDEGEKTIVIDAMQEKNFKSGDWVITQGEDGDVLYVVDSGQLDCFKRFSKGADNTFLKTYVPGEAFGELALLYNAPRAASIQAKEDCCLFSLDRDTFNNIVKDSSIKKREKYENFLAKVQLLDSLDSYERNKICDCLVLETITGVGSYIIRQGETGNTFFLVVEGTCSAYKRMEDGKDKEVFKYNANDYFGELALLRDEPRAASIKSTSATVTVATIDRLAFKRLLGPLEKILERNSERYAAYMQQKGIKLN